MQLTTLALETEVSKLVLGLATRNSGISRSLMTDLSDRFSLEETAGIVLVSLERLIYLDAESFIWAVEHSLSSEVAQEIRRITSVTVGKRLIGAGLQPGKDFSVDSLGRLLLNNQAKAVVLKS
jgi:hypothetical protein